MIISIKKNEKPIVTQKAIGIKMKHNDVEKVMWIPKSLIKNKLKQNIKFLDVPDWLYEEKFKEIFRDVL